MQRFEFVGDRSLSAFGVAREDGWVDHTFVPESLNQWRDRLRAPVDGNGSQKSAPGVSCWLVLCGTPPALKEESGVGEPSRQKDRKGGSSQEGSAQEWKSITARFLIRRVFMLADPS
ncbi:hypothetical protein M434DRAFT_396155 [Hypoxylon sp. CO27-5]|nr:hypothetical protein M434DRAFT_396155 [Hypoxylon sp. CO27-5]